MRHSHPLPLLLALLALAACGEDQSPTAPTSPAEPGDPAFSHTPGHKVVNSLADPGNGICNATQCTLREAIKDPQSTEISFAPGLTGAITLASPGAGGGTLVIEKTLRITGPSGGIVIQRRSADLAFRIVSIGVGDTVKLTNLTLRNGKTDQTGGGLLNFGRLTLINCRVADNSATLGGGGIDNHGRVVLRNSRVTNNTAQGAGLGGVGGGGILNYGNVMLVNSLVTANGGSGVGGIFNQYAARLALTGSTIANNTGGGILSAGTFTIAYSVITGNSSSDRGGGIFNYGSRYADIVGEITNSTVASNSARFGGGIANNQRGRVTIIKSTIAGNSASSSGGGIWQEEFIPVGGGTVTLTNSTVSGNSAPVGGGIFNASQEGGQIILTNSTVARNSATQEGGGVHQDAHLGGRLALTNSLIAQNSAPTGPDVNNPSGTNAVARFTLIGNGSGSGLTNTNGNQVGTASAPIDPKLGSLADNGGPTKTHALLRGSPAIDAASTPDCPTTDQRGVLRPQGAACDIGSYERK